MTTSYLGEFDRQLSAAREALATASVRGDDEGAETASARIADLVDLARRQLPEWS